MRLRDDWQLVLRKAWSIRLILLAAVLSGTEGVLYVAPDLIPVSSPTLALCTFVVTSAALVARITAQKGLT